MNYSIEVLHDQKIIVYEHEGKIRRDEIGDVWRELLKMKEFTSEGYNLLSDYSNGKFDFSIGEMALIDDFLKSLKHILFGKVRGLYKQTIQTGRTRMGVCFSIFSSAESLL
jgi:hypothetical protein